MSYTYTTEIEEVFGITVEDITTTDESGEAHADEAAIEEIAQALEETGQDADSFREMAHQEAEHAERASW